MSFEGRNKRMAKVEKIKQREEEGKERGKIKGASGVYIKAKLRWREALSVCFIN